MRAHREAVAQRFVDYCATLYPDHAKDLTKLAHNLCWDEHCATLFGAEGRWQLTKSEFIIISTLVAERDRPVSAAQLASRLAGGATEDPATKTVVNLISRMRKPLAALSKAVRIEARRGIGYVLRIDVDETPTD